VGDHVSGGDVFGNVYENTIVKEHAIMLGPRAMGTITHIAEKGSYTVKVRRSVEVCHDRVAERSQRTRSSKSSLRERRRSTA
jgi:vacuolar-type H+-ATPase catalytic subunit A/Vma1